MAVGAPPGPTGLTARFTPTLSDTPAWVWLQGRQESLTDSPDCPWVPEMLLEQKTQLSRELSFGPEPFEPFESRPGVSWRPLASSRPFPN